LTVRHDDDEEGHTVTQKQPGQQLFQQPQEVKKKKIRPEERKRLEEEAKSGGQTHHDDTQGFSEVKKRKPNPKGGDIGNLIENAYEQGTNQQQKRDKNFESKGYQPQTRGGKRPYDRQSGTGRGREIAKQGAGGKTTWGNAEKMAKQEVYGEGEEHYGDDLFTYDYSKQQAPKREEATKTEEKTEEPKAEPTQEEEQKPKFEKKEGQREKRRKKRLGLAAEEEKKDEKKSDAPDNSISYKEYKEKFKPEPKQEEKKVAQSMIQKTDLKEKVKGGENLEISIASNKPTTQKKPEVKEKKVDKTESDLNKLIGQKLVEGKTEEAPKDYPQEKRGGYQGKQGKYNKQQKDAGFSFNKDAFPELK